MSLNERTRELIGKYLDDILTEAEEGELDRLLSGDPGAARVFAEMTRFDYFTEVSLREKQAAIAVPQKDSIEKKWAAPRLTWFPQWGWAAAAAAMLLVAVVFYAYTRVPASREVGPGFNLLAVVTPDAKVNLSWKDPFSNEEGFQIERSMDGVTYAEVARVAAGVEHYTDAGPYRSNYYFYRVRAFTSSGYSDYSSAVGVKTTPQFRISVSSRGYVAEHPHVLITGIVIPAGESKRMLIRAIGPSLADRGLSDVLANPRIRLYQMPDKVIAQNDDWQVYDDSGEKNGYSCGGTQEIRASGLAPSGTNSQLESVILITLPPGSYTAVVEGVEGASGAALVGVFEVK